VVEEGVRRVSHLPDLLGGAAVGAILSGVISYFVGRRRGREQLYQEQRVETVNELRRLLREAQWRMVDASAPSEFDDPGDPPRDELIEHAIERVDELDGYHRDRAPWLSEQVQEKVGRLADEYQDKLGELRERIRHYDDEDEAVRPVYDWLEEEMQRIFEDLDRAI
jgi:hypothetical protein